MSQLAVFIALAIKTSHHISGKYSKSLLTRMFRSNLIIVFLAISLANASQHSEGAIDELSLYKKCVNEAANYLSEIQIEGPIRDLIHESRKFYPDALALFNASITQDYVRTMSNFGNPKGCDQLVDHYLNLQLKVPCSKELNRDEEFDLEVMRTSSEAAEVCEACFICQLTDNVSGLGY